MLSNIPKNIYQTHKSLKYIYDKPELSLAFLSWHKWETKGFKHLFYDNEMCDKFMKENFDKHIYNAYSMLPLPVMKADLWRYCIIYKYGGIYADLDTICLYDPHIFLSDGLLTIVPENSTHLCQWVFSAPKESPILKAIIDLCVERIYETPKPIKGEHIIHFLTGPGLFTDAIEKYLSKNNYPLFKHDRTKYWNYPHNIIRVFNHTNFHKNIVKHLFTGSNPDGWTRQRDKLLM
jgi:inositol phosphorylceramide mannosyltransferase catalytic subunit